MPYRVANETRHVARRRAALSLVVCLTLGTVGNVAAQSQSGGGAPSRLGLSLLHTPGPTWDRSRSARFHLYAERGRRPRYSTKALLNSLETAWAEATRMLGVEVRAPAPVTVLVTRSRTRFLSHLRPPSKGLTVVPAPGEGDLVILVHNDTVRAYARHEIMHVVSHRAWGMASAQWLDEGLAMWAERRCQSRPLLAVARDLLREESGLTATAFGASFLERAREGADSRARAYVLAASLVGFILDRGGREELHALWRGKPLTGSDHPLAGDDITAPWRAFVERTAATERGLAPELFARWGCG